jgi:hypothetical protein
MFFEFTTRESAKKILIGAAHVQAIKDTDDGINVVTSGYIYECAEKYDEFIRQLKYSSMQQPQPNMSLR